MATPVPQPELAASLKAGLDTLTAGGSVTFTRYVKVVLPLDGYVFWVRSDIASPSAVSISGQVDITIGPSTLTVGGSLHWSTAKTQAEDELASTNQVIFTAKQEVNDLNAASPDTMWIAYVGPESIPYAFGARGRYYAQADLYHYTGDAVTPAMRTQIVDDPAVLLDGDLIVSNSLPVWLGLNTYVAPYPIGFTTGVTLYPSFAVPENLPPPYGTVHIDPSETMAFTAVPIFDATLSGEQPARDRVRVTLYGLDNGDASDFLASVLQYSADYSIIGLGNMPVIRDEKRGHRDLGILAMKKTIVFEVNYLQGSARNVARQLVESVVTNYQPTAAPPFGA